MKVGVSSAYDMSRICNEQMTFVGFNAQFEAFMGIYSTYKKAYEATEELHDRKYGHRRFSSYESFIESRRQKLKKKML
jgi:hypothetical protein